MSEIDIKQFSNKNNKSNFSFNMIGGDNFICNPNINEYNKICIPDDNNSIKNNTIVTKKDCLQKCDKEYINIQLKKANLYKESLQFYFLIRDLIKKEHMKIYIKGGNVIGLAVLKLIYNKYSNDNKKFAFAFNNFLKMELIKDWDFTAYTHNKEINEKYRNKLDLIAAKYKLVPRAKTFVLYQTKYPILVYEKALFEIAIIDSDSTDFSKMEIPLTTMKVRITEENIKYIFILAKNFYSWTTKDIPIDLDIIKKVISNININIHPHKSGLYDPKNKIDVGNLNSNIIDFIKKNTSNNLYWTQFLITQLEDPYRLIYRMPEKNIIKTEKIIEFIYNYIDKSNKPSWLLDTKKTNNILNKFIEKLGLELKNLYIKSQLINNNQLMNINSVFEFLEGVNFGKPQIQIEWQQFNSTTKNKIKEIFNPLIKYIGKLEFKKIILTLMEKYNLEKAKPVEMNNSQKIIKFFNFLIENNFF
jgi:hypothetical protein